MNVLLDVGGQVEVDDVLDVGDVETTSGNLKKKDEKKKKIAKLKNAPFDKRLKYVDVEITWKGAFC